MTHPTPQDAPDADATGHADRAHVAARRTVSQRKENVPAQTKYVVRHHEHTLSPEYDTREEAELYRIFETPATRSYRTRAVYATDPTPEPRV